ncbi:type II toxin -antitoxin system TacA 1-like antitoxin [Umezawaea beigongshangensis]|uniref:type II toxin -antitoxin system TacA 1-like antitoxin n=1 Tax=Umezawaea beigongshangensis TaxID=2780383 RepID=UPI0018F10EA8|nr:DUF1778 domain-containing protein [Umezawaea beigongshangensis]
MNLAPHVKFLGRELLTVVQNGAVQNGAVQNGVVQNGGDDTGEQAVAVESAIRLAMLEALSVAADEITRELAPGSVRVCSSGREARFVVTLPGAGQPLADTSDRTPEPVGDAAADVEGGPAVRINVRLPERLKAAIENAAAAEGRSVNAWLVRTAAAALRVPDHALDPARRGKRARQHHTGWAR